MFKKILLPLLLLPALALSIPSFAQPPAAEVNPVTGRLPDPIVLRIAAPTQYDRVENQSQLSVRFCLPQTDYCRSPNRQLNLAGKPASSGVSISPSIEGEWRWDYDTQLGFTPKKPWPAGQNFTVTFDDTLLPAGVSLSEKTYSFTTRPLTANITGMTFFQDPADLDKKLVSSTISFNYPVEEESLKAALHFQMTDAQGKPLGKESGFTLQLSEDKTQASVTAPLASLPEQEQFMTLAIAAGIKPLHGGEAYVLTASEQAQRKDGLSWYQQGRTGEVAKDKSRERVLIPSLYSYAKVQSLEAKIIKDDRYVPQQMLVIETNVPMTSEELKQHLAIKLLPQDKPAPVEGQSPKRDYAWQSPTEVTPEILNTAQAVNFSVNPTADEHSTLHSISFTADPARWLHVAISKGMKTQGGYVLGADYANTVQVPSFAKEVKVIPDGAVLSLQGDKKISIYSLGVAKLEIEIGRIKPDSVNHLVSQSHGNFASPDFHYNFDADSISERFTQTLELAGAESRKPQFSALDLSDYIPARPSNKGLFFITVRALEKNKKGEEKSVAEDKRFILVTDLGFFAKGNADGSKDVFVQSIDSGEPVDGASVEVLGKNGLPVVSVETDDGHASLPNLSGFTREKTPVAYLVRDGRDLSFMPFGRYDRQLNYSQFETSGVETSSEGLRAYLFSDRGIYRPGEEVRLGLIVKQGSGAENLEGLPLTLEIMNPRGQVIENKSVRLNAQGFIEHRFSTKDTSPTGIYHARLYIAKDGKNSDLLGNVSVRIEEFLPDTMKITSQFNKSGGGWVTPEGLKASVDLMNLYGTPAANRRISASLNLTPGYFAFASFKDYSFYNARSTEKHFEQPLSDATTDASGHANFDIDLAQYGDSTYWLSFSAEGFEAGSGRSVKTAKTVLVSSLPYVIGSKSSASLSYISKDDPRTLDLIAVNREMKQVAAPDLTISRARISYVTSLVKDSSGQYRYQAVPKETVVDKQPLAIAETGAQLKLDTAAPGDYALIFSDASGTVRQRIAYSVVGESAALGGSRKDVALEVKLDKPSYAPRDTISLSILAPYAGSGLITLETDHVLAYKFFSSDSPSSVQSIDIPKGFEGKGFVNVQFVRDIASKEIYTNPLSYAVVPFFVSLDAMDSAPKLFVPEKVKPGEELRISYKTKHEAKIIVFAVDEGILQYGKYKTPDPLAYLVNQRALQVDTAQIFDLLLPEYSLMRSLSATGGDESLADGKNLNPFKRKTLPPVAFWSGIIDAGEDERVVSYRVPEHFNGSLRVMAVAVSSLEAGAAEAKTTVKGDLIVSPNAPVFVAPGDTFEVTATIANNIAQSGANAKVTLNVEPNEYLDIVGEKSIPLTIAEGKDITATVTVKAKDKPGDGHLVFTASAGDKKARYEATMSVRPAVASSTKLESGYIEKGEKTVAIGRKLYPEFSEASASLSALPLGLVPGLATYLDKYPYGCAEQVMSKSIPAILLYDQPDFGARAKDVEKSVAGTLARLRELQTPDGGFGLWWSDDSPNEFVSVYALHFMTLAKERRFPVPVDMMSRATEYVRQMVNRSVVSLPQARLHAYGIYLLTRNGEVTSNYLPYLVQYLEEHHKGAWKQDLTALYLASTYQMLQLAPEAKALMEGFRLGEPAYWTANHNYWSEGPFYDSLIRYSQYLALLADHFPDELAKLDRNVIFRVANFIGEGSYNSLSSSYAILGIQRYAAAAAKQNEGKLTIAEKTGATVNPVTTSGTLLKTGAVNPQAEAILFSGDAALGLFYQIATSGFDRMLPTNPITSGIDITRSFTNEKGEPVSEAALGEKLNVTITLKPHGNKALENIAIVDLYPGGFDVVPDSISKKAEGEEAQSSTSWTPTATDMREDRLLLFGTIGRDGITYRYQIKAVNKGEFTLPPAYAESMYERGIVAQGLPGVMKVK